MVSAWAFGITVGLLWLFTRKDKRVSEEWGRPLGILGRTAVLILIFHGSFVGCDVSVLKGYLFVVLFVAISMPGLFINPLSVLFYVTGWVFYEWVFWFPSKDEVILSHSLNKNVKERASLVVRRGVAVSDLNPIGKIEIEGEEYEARSALGFILKGELVEVEREDGFELQVRTVEGPRD